MKNILCFGDSNTYGYKPDGSGRYNCDIRWTGRLQKILGEEFNIIEEGLCGRTTVFQDELRPGRRGIDIISVAIESHNPLDVIIIMLGTNDCKTRYGASAHIIAQGIEKIVRKAQDYVSKDTKILVVSPIVLGRGVGEEGYDQEFDKHSEEVSRGLAREYEKVAIQQNVFYMNAAEVAVPSVIDREHMDAESHKRFADAMSRKVLELWNV